VEESLEISAPNTEESINGDHRLTKIQNTDFQVHLLTLKKNKKSPESINIYPSFESLQTPS
jgi:hypothetical protein